MAQISTGTFGEFAVSSCSEFEGVRGWWHFLSKRLPATLQRPSH